MKTVKITLNELKTLMKKMIKEEQNSSKSHKVVSDILANYFVDYLLDGSFKEENEDFSTTYEFSMLIPKGDEVIDGLSNPVEIERYLRKRFGTGSYSEHPGGKFHKTYYNVTDKKSKVLVNILHQSGYDV